MAKMDKDPVDDLELETFFQAGRAATIAPSDRLMVAILQDAQTHQPSSPLLTPTSRSKSFWQELLSQIGGWPALAGMATATVAGLWIGFAAPNELEMLSGGLVLAGDYTAAEILYAPEDLSPSYFSEDLMLAEEG